MNLLRKPEWLKIKRRQEEPFLDVKEIIHGHSLHTICLSGNCPNRNECWSRGTATFMILGNICTRHCKFCNVPSGKPLPPDPEEPLRVAKAIKTMGLKHCVITSVDRDDLPCFGSTWWAETIRQVKTLNPETTIEVLIPDFQGNRECIDRVINEKPDVISHNLETVRRLTPLIRSRAGYETSLAVLRQVSRAGIIAKSGIMLGLGETEEEVLETMDDLIKTGCTVMTIGQYLQPSRDNIPVKEYIHPAVFEQYRLVALQKGFHHVESAPLVRSSYHAEKHVRR